MPVVGSLPLLPVGGAGLFFTGRAVPLLFACPVVDFGFDGWTGPGPITLAVLLTETKHVRKLLLRFTSGLVVFSQSDVIIV